MPPIYHAPPALNRRPLNHRLRLFFGSEEAGERNAVIFTLIENCRLAGVEPCACLKDVLERLPRTTNQQVEQLTPLAWKKARETSFRQAA